jgi:O-antigen ligase
VELVAMLSMVLPIPILRLLGSKSRRSQLLYSLSIVVLLSAMFATQRKSALVLPAAVILTLAYFRRRQLISLAPLGLVLLVMVALISPGVIHGVISQFTASNSTHTATVSDRTADYDAVRPDVWTHLAFGRGYGSYDPHTYRVLDSEILGPMVETGLVGLAAYLMIGVSLILFARKPALRDPKLSAVAICGVTAGVVLLVSSLLYDFLGFPHGATTFLYFAGLVVAAIRPGAQGPARPPPPSPHTFRGHGRPRRRSRPVGEPVLTR